MPASAFLLGASAAARIASLNLCTDEYLLLLARPDQIVGISYLSRDPRESPLWRKAQRYQGNRGSIEDVLTLRPTLVLSMGGVGGRATSLLASRLHIRMLELPYAADFDGVGRNLRLVATAVGEPARAAPWIARLKALQAGAPSKVSDAIWISGHGDSLVPGSLGAQWLRLAGYAERALPGGRATLETLLISPPQVLVRSDYRSGQMSGGVRWLDHPIVRRAGSRQVITDGRPWTCLGPLMIPEIERLRRAAR
jgi:iron complex transport system substrate-binding protein